MSHMSACVPESWPQCLCTMGWVVATNTCREPEARRWVGYCLETLPGDTVCAPPACLGTRSQNPHLPPLLHLPMAQNLPRGTEISCPVVSTVCCTRMCIGITQDCAQGRRSLGLRITPGGAHGVPKEMVARAGVICPSGRVGASPQPHGLLPEWTPPPAQQPIWPGTGIPLKLKPLAFCTAIPVKFFRKGKIIPPRSLQDCAISHLQAGREGTGCPEPWLTLDIACPCEVDSSPCPSPCLSLRARHWWELGPLEIWGLNRAEARAVLAWSPSPPCNKSCCPG